MRGPLVSYSGGCVQGEQIHPMGVLPAVYNEGEPAVLQPFDMFGMS